MTFEDFIQAEEDLQNAINSINKRVRQHRAGNIDGITISQNEVMQKARDLKVELLTAWQDYKTELQGLVN